MRSKSFQQFLSLLALLGMAHATNFPIAQCTAQAWVRAPDLTPDTVIQGDARVKISAECPAVESVTLGLCLKERSFVKALRSQEDRDWVTSAVLPTIPQLPPASPWVPLTSHSSNPSDEITLQEMLVNKDLWVVREEERMVFETTQTIHLVDGASGDHDVVQEFAVLVPSTNFPPGLDHLGSGILLMVNPYQFEMVDVEFMYEYFVRIPFENGTTKEISAGFTAFQPLHDPADTPRGQNSGTTVLEPQHIARDQRHSLITNYTVQVTGSAFTQGSENQAVTVVVTRTGPARTFTKPLTIHGSIHPIISSKWATKYDVPNLQPNRRPEYILRSTLEDCQGAAFRRPRFDDGKFTVTMPNSTANEIESQEIVTTTSAPVTLPIKVNRRHIINFETYYQMLSNSLSITLGMPRTQNEIIDPDHPFSPWQAEHVPPHGRMFADDEEPWVPWEKTVETPQLASWGVYSGSIPVTVHPMGQVAPSCYSQPEMDMPGQVVLFGEAGCQRSLINHYLDEGSRGPTFVDSSAVHELLAEGPAERERRAPILQPVVSSPPDGEELIYRYYSNLDLIYVGETWVKKVTNKASSLH